MRPTFQGHKLESRNTLDVVDGYTPDNFVTERPVTLKAARPLVLPPEIELLETRVSLLLRKFEGTFVGDMLSFVCTDRWPPAGFGPTYPIQDFEVGVGERISVAFFIRAKQQGDFTVSGVVIDYEERGSLRRQQTDAVTVNIVRREKVEDLPSGNRSCIPTVNSPWLCEDPAAITRRTCSPARRPHTQQR